MNNKSQSIPLNTLSETFNLGIVIARNTIKDLRLDLMEKAHRDDYHLFFILDKGSGLFECDFQQYQLKPRSVMYIQPYQVHRGLILQDLVFSVLLINNENLNQEYIQLLKDISPTEPLHLDNDTFTLISEMIGLCLKFQERKHEVLYQSLLKDSCNTLVALITSQYLVYPSRFATTSRFSSIAKRFKNILDNEFIQVKQPIDYAQRLKISVGYLNECVKKTSGRSVTYHIHQRIILEAKRLLYHSNKSIKEIAIELGYEDYSYFSRLFKKTTGISASTFRDKNRD